MNSSLFAKLRFFAVYLLSVGFIVVIIGLLTGMGNPKDGIEAPAVTTTEDGLWEANKYLHNRVAELNALYATSLQDPERRYRNGAELQKAETAFAASLDSLQNGIAGKDDAQKPAWEEMVSAFRREVESRKAVLQAYTNQPQPTTSSAPVNQQQLTDLQAQVQQRDAAIAELNKQLATRPTVATNNQRDDSELARTVSGLRASLDKAKAENAALNRSYKAVVDDHKRVLAQLQSARKG